MNLFCCHFANLIFSNSLDKYFYKKFNQNEKYINSFVLLHLLTTTYKMGIVQRDGLKLTIISYTGVLIGYLNKVFLFTRFLTTEQVGLANLLVFLATLFAHFSAMGSFNIVYRFFPFFKDEKKQHHGFLFGVILIAAAGFALATVLFLSFHDFFNMLFLKNSPLLVEYSLYLIPLALGSLVYTLFESYLRSLKKNLVSNFSYEIIMRIITSAVILIFAVGFIDFQKFVLFYVIANCIPAIIVVAYTFYKKQLFIKPKISLKWKRLFGIMMSYGLFSTFNNMSFLLLSSIDAFMVAGMLTLGAAGIYTTIMYLTNLLLVPYKSITNVSIPLVAEYWKNKNIVGIESLYKKVSSTGIAVSGAIFLLIWINIDSFFYFTTPEYSAGKYVFLILGIGRLIDIVTGLNGIILLTSKRYKMDLVFTLSLVFVTIFTNWIFIPLYGINGAALATMISISIYNIAKLLYVKYKFGIHPFQIKQLTVPILILLITFIFSFVGRLENVFADLLVKSIVAGLLYAVPLFFIKLSTEINLEIIKHLNLIKELIFKK